MDLERVSADLRPRNPWEAIDLGFALARVNGVPLYGAWLALMLPLVLGIGLGTVEAGVPWLGPLLLWWAKPALDRVPLHVLSRALFGAAPSVGETLRAAPRLWLRRLPSALTFARLDPIRAFAAPIFQLEGQTGSPGSRRRAVLSRGMLGPSLGLLMVCHLMELVVITALFAFVVLFLPDTPEYAGSALWASFWHGAAPRWLELLLPLGYGLAVLVIEPLYVAGGFALYLNRRTGLEGWDVEVAFRRLAARLSLVARAGLLLAALLLGGAVAGGAHAGEVAVPVTTAQPVPNIARGRPATQISVRRGTRAMPLFWGGRMPPPQRLSPPLSPRSSGPRAPLARRYPSISSAGWMTLSGSSPEAGVRAVLARPEFPHTDTQTHWRWRFQQEAANVPLPGAAFGGLLAQIFEAILWTALVAAVIGLVVLLVRSRGPARAKAEADAPPRPVLGIGLDLRPESLPRNISDAAWALWQEGRRLEAVALLYRGALVDLINQRQMAVEDGATERDCLQLAARLLDSRAALYFIRLTGAWQEAAYGHRFPADEAASKLCRLWPEHFRGVA